MALEHGAVVEAVHPAAEARVGARDDGVLARLDLFHVDANRSVKDDAEIGCASRHVGGTGAGDEGLGGDAADVDAGATEELTLDHGYLEPFVVEAVGE